MQHFTLQDEVIAGLSAAVNFGIVFGREDGDFEVVEMKIIVVRHRFACRDLDGGKYIQPGHLRLQRTLLIAHRQWKFALAEVESRPGRRAKMKAG